LSITAAAAVSDEIATKTLQSNSTAQATSSPQADNTTRPVPSFLPLVDDPEAAVNIVVKDKLPEEEKAVVKQV
jgi:hypothetical protein